MSPVRRKPTDDLDYDVRLLDPMDILGEREQQRIRAAQHFIRKMPLPTSDSKAELFGYANRAAVHQDRLRALKAQLVYSVSVFIPVVEEKKRKVIEEQVEEYGLKKTDAGIKAITDPAYRTMRTKLKAFEALDKSLETLLWEFVHRLNQLERK